MYKKIIVGMMTAITIISMATLAFAEDAVPRYTNAEIKNDILLALKKENRKTIVPSTVFISKESNSKNDSSQNNLTIAFSTSKAYPITVTLYRIDVSNADTTIVVNDSKDKKVADKTVKKVADADKKAVETSVVVYGPEEMGSTNFGRYYHPEKNPKLGTYKLVINQTDSKDNPVLTEVFSVVSVSTLPTELKENIKAPLLTPSSTTNSGGNNK